jgi:hypothetical protein
VHRSYRIAQSHRRVRMGSRLRRAMSTMAPFDRRSKWFALIPLIPLIDEESMK